MSDFNELTKTLDKLISDSFTSKFAPQKILEKGQAALRLDALRKEHSDREPLPACKYLETIFNAQEEKQSLAVKRLKPVWRKMHWLTNDNYRDQPEMSHYLKNSAFCEIVGPYGLIVRKDVSIGYLFIGPNVNYPAHDHLSPEEHS